MRRNSLWASGVSPTGPVLRISLSLLLVIFLASAAAPGAVGAFVSHTGTAPQPVWSQAPITSAIPADRTFASAVWLGGTNPSKGVLFGGLGCGGYCGDTWVFSQSQGTFQWFPAPSQGPSARSGAAMALDPLLGGAVLYGGQNNGSVYGDGWIFYGGNDTWARLHWTSTPPPLANASMVYDAALNSLVLFGGELTNGSASGSTWLLKGTGWIQAPTPTAPSPRWSVSLGYDPTNSEVVLFGGGNSSLRYNDTWVFRAGGWSLVPFGAAPSARMGAATSVSAGGFLVIYGGIGDQGALNDTWIFLNGSWQNLTPQFTPGLPTPGPVGGALLVPASGIKENLFILAGYYPGYYNSTGTWQLYLPMGGNPGGLTFTISASPTQGQSPLAITFSASPTGGMPPYNYTWDFGPTQGNAYGPSVTHVFQTTVETTFGVTLTVTDSQGNSATANTQVTVYPPYTPPPPPPAPPWVLLGLLWLAAGVLAYEGFSAAGAYRRRARWRRSVRVALNVPVTLPYPLSLGRALRQLALDRDFGKFLREVRKQTVAWLHPPPQNGQLRPRARGEVTFLVLRLVSSVVAKLLLIVTVVFFLVNMVALVGTPQTPLGLLTSWGSAERNFFTGTWLSASFPVGLSTLKAAAPMTVLLPSSLELGAVSLLLSALLSFPLGMISGWKRGGAVDGTTRGYSALGLFMPTLVLAFLIGGWFYMVWLGIFGPYASINGILPSNPSWYDDNMGRLPSWITMYGTTSPTGFPLVDGALHGAWTLELYVLANTLLQAFIIALIYSSVYLRYIRLSAADAAEEPYIVAVRSRGVSESRLLWRHVAARSLPLYISTFSATFGAFLITLTMVEVAFSDVGIGADVWLMLSGSYSFSALAQVVVPIVYVFTLAVVLTNVLADFLVSLLDRRVIKDTRRGKAR